VLSIFFSASTTSHGLMPRCGPFGNTNVSRFFPPLFETSPDYPSSAFSLPARDHPVDHGRFPVFAALGLGCSCHRVMRVLLPTFSRRLRLRFLDFTFTNQRGRAFLPLQSLRGRRLIDFLLSLFVPGRHVACISPFCCAFCQYSFGHDFFLCRAVVRIPLH